MNQQRSNVNAFIICSIFIFQKMFFNFCFEIARSEIETQLEAVTETSHETWFQVSINPIEIINTKF